MEFTILGILSRLPAIMPTMLFFVLACILRIGLGLDMVGLGSLLLISIFLQISPLLVQRKLGWNIGLSLIASTLGFVFIGLIFKSWSLPFLGVVFFLLVPGLNKPRVDNENEPESYQWAGWIVLALASLWLFSVSLREVWASGYLSPFFKENILLPRASRDSLSYINYGTMIHDFGILGAGIHGLVEIKYHIGSIIFMIAVSEAVQRPLDFVYPFGAPLILIPLLFSNLHLVACELCKANHTKTRLAIFGAIAILIAQIVGQGHLDAFGLWKSYFVSESYTLSLALLIAYVGALWNLLQRITKKLGWLEALLLSVTPGILVFTKISVGVIACVFFGLYFLYSLIKSPRKAPYFVAIFSALLALLVERLTRIPMPSDWVWNIFIQKFGRARTLMFHLVHYYHFWLLLIGCGLLYRQKRSSTLVRTCLIATSVTFVVTWPILHMAIPGGSGYYFTNIVMWIAILGLLAIFSMQESRIQKNLLAVGFILSCNNAIKSSRSVSVLRQEAASISRAIENPEKAAYRNFVKELRSLRDYELKKKSFVYISSEQKAYWQAWPQTRICNEAALLPFGESQIPLIFGIPTHAEKDCWEQFSVPAWVGADYRMLPEKPNDHDLCSETKRFGRTQVIKLEQVPGTDFVRRIILTCSTEG